MDIATLRSWLTRHGDDISAFTDYEPDYDSDKDLEQILETSWYVDIDWNLPGWRFASLGQDGTGSQFYLWLEPNPGTPSPVVFFGSEGGVGVLAPSAVAFIQALAYGPGLEEYGSNNFEAPSRLSLEKNWFLSDNNISWEVEEAHEALARYRACVEEQFGPLPPFETLVHIPDWLQSKFYGQVISVRNRIEVRERQAELETTERKHQDRRDKASHYAATSSASLPSNATTLLDSSIYQGECAVCGKAGSLRLTRYDEFTFGICPSCYFSNAW